MSTWAAIAIAGLVSAIIAGSIGYGCGYVDGRMYQMRRWRP